MVYNININIEAFPAGIPGPWNPVFRGENEKNYIRRDHPFGYLGMKVREVCVDYVCIVCEFCVYYVCIMCVLCVYYVCIMCVLCVCVCSSH